ADREVATDTDPRRAAAARRGLARPCPASRASRKAPNRLRPRTARTVRDRWAMAAGAAPGDRNRPVGCRQAHHHRPIRGAERPDTAAPNTAVEANTADNTAPRP